MDFKNNKDTDLANKVYAQLTSIKEGEVWSYSELSKRIGCPRAVRAVATIVGQNKYPVTIPCHRIIKRSGELGQYTYKGKRSSKKKRDLLVSEGVIFKGNKVIYAPHGLWL